MGLESLEEEVLDLNLFRYNDDEEDMIYKRMLQALVDGTVTPPQAAADFDSWIGQETNTRLTRLLARPDPWKLTLQEYDRGVTMRSLSPNATGTIQMVFESIATLCSAFPPFHQGQDAIVHFMEALRALPEHKVHDRIPPKEDDNDGYDDDNSDPQSYMTTLWPFGGTWLGLTAMFQREAEGESATFITTAFRLHPDANSIIYPFTWSAIARITALGLIDCGFLSALDSILPSSPNYPDFEERKVGGPNRVSGDTLGAAQWIVWPEMGRFVYRQCKKPIEDPESPAMWTLERWQSWKDEFSFIAGDDRFNPKARLAAKLSRGQMTMYEEEEKKEGDQSHWPLCRLPTHH